MTGDQHRSKSFSKRSRHASSKLYIFIQEKRPSQKYKKTGCPCHCIQSGAGPKMKQQNNEHKTRLKIKAWEIATHFDSFLPSLADCGTKKKFPQIPLPHPSLFNVGGQVAACVTRAVTLRWSHWRQTLPLTQLRAGPVVGNPQTSTQPDEKRRAIKNNKVEWAVIWSPHVKMCNLDTQNARPQTGQNRCTVF